MVDNKYYKSDWSQPTLSNAAGTGPWKEGDAFSGVRTSLYWSSTTYAGFTVNAWVVDLGNGNVVNGYRTITSYIWPVRGGV